MTALLQKSLGLGIAAKVSLVSLKTISASTGWHIDEVTERADEWPWVFDLSTGSRKVTERRVWKACLEGDTSTRKLADVLAEVIGTETADVRGAMLETRWDVSNQTLKRLTEAGEFSHRVGGHTLWIERASLVAFLTRRLIP